MIGRNINWWDPLGKRADGSRRLLPCHRGPGLEFHRDPLCFAPLLIRATSALACAQVRRRRRRGLVGLDKGGPWTIFGKSRWITKGSWS
jgi:hypothetical protein